MVRAILSGSKTVTRRICRDANKLTVPLSDTIDHNARTYTVEGINEDGITQYLAERRMPYAAGDILWVRETWAYGNIETSDFEARANESWFEEARFPVKPFGEYHVPILFYRADMDEKDARTVHALETIDPYAEGSGAAVPAGDGRTARTAAGNQRRAGAAGRHTAAARRFYPGIPLPESRTPGRRMEDRRKCVRRPLEQHGQAAGKRTVRLGREPVGVGDRV